MIMAKKMRLHFLQIAIFLLGLTFALLFLFNFNQKINAAENEILLDPAEKSLRMGDEFKVDILISTREKLLGADVKIIFDPTVIEVLGIEDGKAFKLTPLKVSKDGSISIVGLAESKNKFSGKAVFATLKLKAKDAGDTKLKIAFSKGSTTDSNLTKEKATDVLTKVGEGHYIIGTAAQRTGAGIKKSTWQIILIIIIILFIGALIFLYFRWRKYQKETEDIFVPSVPLDRPPPSG
ncbi:MAG: hypothetical protein A2172_02085 [Candidatus Woykebacteria bacterium RBG_13_40_15]|uniref:Cohesin domain-containing protein n=1 Tax=Candidatus Woykebacteria bacterium RBG_13_40_15 TaxID=1802593 RepID=A0A1G1W633_9BACT|nr:MAG: hypothetical protein A2172_02085 [Candidatus Woykebacteria bacterium RBG_13_40_15]